MFVVSMKATKSHMISLIFCIALIAAMLIAALCFPAERTMIASTAASGADDAACAAYIKSLGYTAELPAVAVREIRLPDEFDESLVDYNALQQQAGFDLSAYRGQRLKLRTYDLAEHPSGTPAQVHLYVYNGLIVGGDITTEDGQAVEPLVKAEGPSTTTTT